MSEGNFVVPDSILPSVEVTDWIGPSGVLRVGGVDYHLPTMDVGELNALHLQLATAADKMRQELTDADRRRIQQGLTMASMRAWYDQTRQALALCKKQMQAIHADFARRKTLIPPLEEFAFSAVHELYGEVGLGRVMTRARALQAQRRKEIVRKGKPISRYLGDRDKVCGTQENPKIRYEDEEAAGRALDHMEAVGQDTTGLSVYGPCPWCNKYHLGHSPEYQRRKRQQANRQAAAAAS